MSNIDTTTEKVAAAAAQGAPVAPEKASAKKGASHKKAAPKAIKGAKKGTSKKGIKPAAQKSQPNTKAGKTTVAAVPREFSKKEIVLDLLRRKGGATLAELMAATKWQAHSIRGFISGMLGKKMDLPVVSAKRDDGERVYSLAK